VSVQMTEARDDAGEDLLGEHEKDVRTQSTGASSGWFSPGEAATERSVQLKPRQSKGKNLALLRGVVQVRYPMQTQAREVTDFSAPQSFPIAAQGLQTQISIEPPRLENGQWRIHASAKGTFNTGWRVQMQPRIRQEAPLFGETLLPTVFTFTDAQGRTWRGRNTITLLDAAGPQGGSVEGGSPPPPRPDDFTYIEGSVSVLELMPPADAVPTPPAPPGTPPRVTLTPSILHRTGEATYISQGSSGSLGQPVQLSPEELAKVRFTKATFSTESDWRTLEVPFEFRDLPLPPR